ncbi:MULTISPECIES: tellurite resistance TerB family protein [Alcaligenes]|jgi:uncharacterized membrane protein YebE (DUF533 family)|uniref:Tellurite resistance TerB family protein n=1 Tax=Alcaligenes aquatilis TaxID=323284 RepID=A0A3G2HU24_9BURK|nr:MULTISPECIES: tellurite resistance TerB family protein [Alcaligenes]AYN20554.1 tellurite resistance TerB family protein [Alcaligenes aquatilis]MCH4224526.1 tellurite resistance TerB family protein [Alcaligenes faecalis]UQN37364.1 tellurite resistance TerB family protein [Alcaligenes aquatilis]UYY88619.1 tellurite resistance TerB family protein [Alcaligenes sp. SMD-FA]HBQ89788.1 DUF533 domain-containing protein [Alcaligenes faecalis]
MSLQQMLQQILQSGQSALKQGQGQLNTSGLGKKISEQAGGFGGGAVVGGVLGVLLGNKKFRKMGGSMAAYGGAAALGALAVKVYQNWQEQNAGQQAAPSPVQAVPPAPLPLAASSQADTHAMVILAALVSAAKADGHIGDAERELIDAEIDKMAAPEQARHWLSQELLKPVDPQAVAQLAQTPEMAAEIYLTSVLAIDEQSYMERAYLDELARLLSLPDSLRKSLDNQVQALTTN